MTKIFSPLAIDYSAGIHVDDDGQLIPNKLGRENLQVLCQDCHKVKTAEDIRIRNKNRKKEAPQQVALSS